MMRYHDKVTNSSCRDQWGNTEYDRWEFQQVLTGMLEVGGYCVEKKRVCLMRAAGSEKVRVGRGIKFDVGATYLMKQLDPFADGVLHLPKSATTINWKSQLRVKFMSNFELKYQSPGESMQPEAY
ncbi:hypothetical protein EDD22DRAFT_1050418 [Suillus occidentalis]|nr:hypothetical protein EDD22DRAFT_1050418 [Suillus occidentalis]